MSVKLRLKVERAVLKARRHGMTPTAKQAYRDAAAEIHAEMDRTKRHLAEVMKQHVAHLRTLAALSNELLVSAKEAKHGHEEADRQGRRD